MKTRSRKYFMRKEFIKPYKVGCSNSATAYKNSIKQIGEMKDLFNPAYEQFFQLFLDSHQ